MFNDILDEKKGFKYQITVKILLKKHKGTEIEFSPVYFNSTTKTVINHKFDLDKSFQEILYRTDNWVNAGSGCIVESTESQYINISTFRFLGLFDMLSDYCKKIANKYGIKIGNVKKLVPNLGNKTNYVVHYRNLKLCLSLGMKLTKIQNFKI